ncbi:MAG: DNA/RNA non-specific endonuclease [Bacteroidales bacterium]|nr:DNA/RNA non-specific endonuclease [Bacteroidales bacterium]
MKKFRLLLLAVLLGFGLISCDFKAVNAENKAIAAQEQENKQEQKATFNQDSIQFVAPLTNKAEQIVERKAYIVSYNKDTKCPNWVAWKLTAERCNGELERPQNAFQEDKDVPKPRATLADYKKSGWTRGHMCPAGDNKWDEDAMMESFLLTNMCPQSAALNSGRWNDIERLCRQWVEKYGELYIICGPIFYNQEHQTIGTNKVVVPEAFFKVVVSLGTEPKAIGFICKNMGEKKSRSNYVNSIDEIERITGYDFFPNLDDKIEKMIEVQKDLNNWQK